MRYPILICVLLLNAIYFKLCNLDIVAIMFQFLSAIAMLMWIFSPEDKE